MVDDNGGWIRIEVFCEKHGQRANTVRKRVHDGSWPRGEIYASPEGGQGYIHEARALAWLREKGKLQQ
jgi:hypothetical protein